MAEFWQKHFVRNFITNNRWQYLTAGLGNTLIITLFALVLGVAFGSLIAVVRVTHDKSDHPGLVLRVLNRLARIYLTVVRGTPMMVQMLIAYFVIFVAWDPGKIPVAIFAFGLNSAAYVAEIIRGGINSIDPGQMEAGRSLGLGYRETMINIILPQAVKNVLPALCNEGIALLKETSIAGYIGLGDLTRGAMQIQSQTYDPFPPLLAIAAIYLCLVMILTKLVSILERRLAQSDRG